VGRELLRLRTASELSQQRVADAVGVKRATVAQWEAGRFSPAAEKLRRLDELFGSANTLQSLARSGRAAIATLPLQRPASVARGPSLAEVYQKLADRLVAEVIVDGDAVGWRSVLGSKGRPTPWSTAIAVRTLLLLDRADVDLAKIARTLARRQQARGWSNRALTVPRPDVTAVVLATLSRIGDGGADLEDAWDWLGSAFDPAGRHLTFVLSTALQHLAPLRPESPLVATLVDLLLGLRVDAQGFRAWVANPPPGPHRVEASVAHTARAVVALKAATAHTDRQDVQDAIGEATAFLAADDNDDGVTEIQRIHPEDRTLDVPVEHFTSAHVVRALAGSDVPRKRLDSALAKLWDSYAPAEGLWVWRLDGRLPLWMNYDAVLALRAVAFADFPASFDLSTGDHVDRTDGAAPQPPSPRAGR
jgi:transcriptional regulator with XRE-family HTH domain